MEICQTCGACFDDGFDLCSYDGGGMHSPFLGPRVLGERYLLEQRLASGAMGVVFRATHLQIGSTVAVKLMQPRKDELQVALARFHREAQVLGQIKHPNAVLVMDFGVEDRGPARVPYLVMEFLRGESLEDLLERRGALSLEEAERIITPLCEAVEEAHQVGVVHRDIKPSNVLLERLRDGNEIVKVVDFGIAKFVELSPEALRRKAPDVEALLASADTAGEPEFLDELMHVRESVAGTIALRRRDAGTHTIHTQEDAITEAGFMVGTLPFMAPEQISGGRISRQTDVYAIASLVFRLLGGRLPFEGDDEEVIAAKLSDDRPTFHGLGLQMPQVLEDCLQKCFALHPPERPQSVLAISGALREAVRGASDSDTGAPPVDGALQQCLLAMETLALCAEVYDFDSDAELHYGQTRDALLSLDGAVQRLRRALESASRSELTAIPAEALQRMEDGSARVAHALTVLHGQGAAGEFTDYLGVLWARMVPSVQFAVEHVRSHQPVTRNASSGRLRPVPFKDVSAEHESALQQLAERLMAKDILDSSEALETVLGSQQDVLITYLARGALQPDALCESLLQGLWRHADALLLLESYPIHRPLRLLPLLTSLQQVEASRPFALLSRLYADSALESDEGLARLPSQLGALGESSGKVLWRCLLLHPGARVRALAMRNLSLADFWTVVVHPRTPILLQREVFEHVCVDATPEYLKVFFLCVRDHLDAASEAEEIFEAFRLLQHFFTIPCFHEDVVFEPLLQVDRTLRTRCSALGLQVPAEDSYVDALAEFSAGGVTESLAPTHMPSIPLPIQRRLARDGHFLSYFVAHTNERVARETLPHLFRMEDITRYLRIPSIHRAVLLELAKNRRFFRQEGARLALLQNPKTPAHVARQFLPFIGHEQLRFLAANRHISNEVRQLAASFLERLQMRVRS